MAERRGSGWFELRVAAFGVLALVLAVVGFAPAVAHGQSKFIHRVLAEGSGSGVGEFGSSSPLDVAVNRASIDDPGEGPAGGSADGFTYVPDNNHHRVQVFDSDGEFRFMFGGGVLDGQPVAQVCVAGESCQAGVSGGLGGMLDGPQGVVVDQQTGHVFVRTLAGSASSPRNPRVQEFEADGTFVRMWGFDVVQDGTGDDTGTGFETCFVAAECQRGTVGSGLGQFGNSSTLGAGIDLHVPSGDVLVADPGNSRILRFDVPADTTLPVSVVEAIGPVAGLTTTFNAHVAVDDDVVYAPASSTSPNDLVRYDLDTAAFLDPLSVATVTGDSARTFGLEIDPVSGNLLIARSSGFGASAISHVFELADPGGPAASVSLVDTHVDVTGLAYVGLGLDPDGDGILYPTVLGAVYAAEDGPLPPAQVALQPYTGIGARQATVNFEIDPQGLLPVDYQVQLSNPASLGQFVTLASGQVDGSDDPVAVAETVTGLRPGTPYQMRVVMTKPFGNPSAVIDNPTPLVTQPAAPSVIEVAADSISDTTARLTAKIDPNGEDTSYRFEWGTNGLENTIPVPDGQLGDGYGFQFVNETLTDLASATTYQFRLVATSAQGTTTQNGAFTTSAAPDFAGRAYELVSPPDKCGGVGVGFWPAGLGHLGSSGVAAHIGERFAAQGQYGSTLDCDGAFSHSNDWSLAERADSQHGWQKSSLLTHPNYNPQTGQPVSLTSGADDLSTMYWKAPSTLALFPEMETWATEINVGMMSGWSGPIGTPARWELFAPTSLDQAAPRSNLTANEFSTETFQPIVFSGSGSTAVGQPGVTDSGPSAARGLPRVHGLEGPDDPTWPAFGDLVRGRSLWSGDFSGGLADSFAGTGARELVNVCTDGAGRTALPAIDGEGDIDDVGCPAGNDGRERLLSHLGAAFAPGVYVREGAVSEDGSRTFFLAPDPDASGVPNGASGSQGFCSGTGDSSLCPPQLFVSQRNPGGGVVTRWVSKPAAGLLGEQDASLLGTARFEGASADGKRVFFRSNSPLTADDPNGGCGAPCLSGSPSNESWDLYMFEFADGPDPTGPGSSLIRVSAGPGLDGDCNSPLRSSSGADNDQIGALRYVSDDGARAYFTCQAPLPGVEAPDDPTRITEPGGTTTTSNQTNLYLFDLNRAQQEHWRFVARLPRATGDSLATCATTGVEARTPFVGRPAEHPAIAIAAARSNCVRGTADGAFVTLFTVGRLTVDDPGGTPADDQPGNPVADIYGYDAEADRLVRVTAPQGGDGAAYPCIGDVSSTPGDDSLLFSCRADGGMDLQNGVSNPNAPLPMNLGVASVPLVSGDRVAFFQSASRLTGDDLDDGYDVYEWRNGRLSLLTDGSPGSEDALYKGNDVTGRDVYFVTRQSLTWQDHDVVADIYSARVGGGIVEPDLPPVCGVLMGSCQGGGFDSVSSDTKTQSSSESGNAKAEARKTLAVSRLSKKARRKASRTGRVPIKVRASSTGRVSLTVKAKLGKKVRRVGRASKRAVKGRAMTVNVRLSKAAKRRLRSGKKLRVTVQVRQSGARTRTRSILLPGVKR